VIRVMLVDDHPVVRAGLRSMIDSEPDLVVVAEAADGEQALLALEELESIDAVDAVDDAAGAVDVVLMDLQMPLVDGVAATARIAARPDPPPVLVLTTYDTDADILRAIEAGATGYMLKDAPPDELCRAVRSAAAGQAVFHATVASRVLGHMRNPDPAGLSAREIEILTLVAQGLANRQIAAQIYLSEATVKTHLVHIFDKLGVDNRTAAVAAGVDRGIIRLR